MILTYGSENVPFPLHPYKSVHSTTLEMNKQTKGMISIANTTKNISLLGMVTARVGYQSLVSENFHSFWKYSLICPLFNITNNQQQRKILNKLTGLKILYPRKTQKNIQCTIFNIKGLHN